MTTRHRKRGIARCAAVLAALLGGVVVAASAQATPLRPQTAPAAGGVPALVDPSAELAAQPPGPEVAWVDSNFIAGRVRGGGHDFGILVHTLLFPNADQRKLFIAVTDLTTGWHRNYEAAIPKDRYTWSHKRLHISMPGLTWTGGARQMQVKATTPWGSLKARFTPKGPVLNYTGAGVAQLLGDVDYEYAFPTMRTTGTLTAEGATRRVTGASWLDRQWGPLPLLDPSMRWTWMNISLSNGDRVAIWDILNKTAQNSWATVQHPDGSYELAAVRPLADGAEDPWTSPVTGKTFPTRWRIAIPTLGARLSVVTSPKGQEFPDGHVEATAAVTGRYKGRKVTGTTYVEMTGDWKG